MILTKPIDVRTQTTSYDRYVDENLGLELNDAMFALDCSTIVLRHVRLRVG